MQKDAKCLQFDKEGEMLTAADQLCVEKAAVTVKEKREMNVNTSYFYWGRGKMPEGNALVIEGSRLQKCKFL